MIKVTVWTEHYQDQMQEDVIKIYPDGMHECLASFLKKDEEFEVRTATLDMHECGLTDAVLENTDVLIWWGHCRHKFVPDELVEKIYNRVMRGMGIIFLHSAHFSKPFKRLMGTTCSLCWRDGDRERLINIAPNHRITQGIDKYVEIEEEEMYGERFDIPTPDEVVFLGWFSGGEAFRSGCTWYKGLGKVFYFQPGHEANPTYHMPEIQKIITNAVHWAAPYNIVDEITCPHVEPPEATWNERHPNKQI